MLTLFSLLLVISFGVRSLYSARMPESATQVNKNEFDVNYWRANAEEYLRQKLEEQKQIGDNLNQRARNVILFLGDGMSLRTVTATRQYLGNAGLKLSFEKFPYFGLSKTYCLDKQVPDSAATGTAYLSGVKANYGTIGVTGQVQRSDCKASLNESYHTESIAKWAQDAGLWTGLVTTARVTHASPASLYAHAANREWENDEKVNADGCNPELNVDIARQLVEDETVGSRLRVVLGGGRRNFFDESDEDDYGYAGRRQDGRNLIADWLSWRHKAGSRARYVKNKIELHATNLNETDQLIGLFCSSHCPYHGDLERDKLTNEIPSLSEMTVAAIKLLQQRQEGYFLFVEGARIDMAHHENRARLSLEDTVEFANAVKEAREMTSPKDTLIIATADHSHTMTIGGNPKRGDDILGLNPEMAADNLPYTILSYANGPGYTKTYSKSKKRKDLSGKNFQNPRHRYMATIPLESETHGPDDVGVFASGPYAHLFSGNYLQSNLPILMAKALTIGPFRAS